MPNEPAHTDPDTRKELEKSWGKPAPVAPPSPPSNPVVSS